MWGIFSSDEQAAVLEWQEMLTMKRAVWIGVVVVVLMAALGSVAAVGWYGKGVERMLVVEGKDRWEFHRRIGGEFVAKQTFIYPREWKGRPTGRLAAMHVLMVDMTRSGEETPLVLTLRDAESGTVRREARVSSAQVKDDYYLPFTFEPLAVPAGQTLELEVGAPDSTNPPHFAVRISDVDVLPNGYFVYRGAVQPNQDLAFVAYHEVPKYRVWWMIWRSVRARAKLLGTTLAVGFAGAILLAAAVQRGRRAKAALLLSLLALALITRIPALKQIHGEVGGDAYYNLTLAHSLIHGRNVFKDDIQRVPGYPALLVPAFFIPGIPDLLWGRLVNVAATLGAVALLWPLSRILTLRPAVAAVAAALVIGNKDFFITSLRPLPYAVYTFELLASIVLCFTIKKPWQLAAWGALLGGMSMTRQEGFVAGAWLVAAQAGRLWQWRKFDAARSWRAVVWRLALVAIPAVAITAPYFVNNWLTFGNPFFSAYFLDRDDISTPRSLADFRDENLVKAWGLFSSTWRHIDERDILLSWREGLFKYVLAGVALLWGAAAVFRRWARGRALLWPTWLWWLRLAAYLILSIFLVAVAYDWAWRRGPSITEELNMVAVAFMLLGVLELVRVGRPARLAGTWAGGLVVAVILSQWLVGTWFDPHMKHYHQVLPLLSLGMAAVLLPFFGITAKRQKLQPQRSLAAQFVLTLPLTLALALMFVRVHDKLELYVDSINFRAARIHVLMAAEEFLELTEGPVAMELQEDYGLPYYLEGRMNFFTDENADSERQWRWVVERSARYLIDSSEMNTLTVQDDPPYAERFELLREFRQEEKSGYAQWTKVYRVHGV